jgi:hypothetical protein
LVHGEYDSEIEEYVLKSHWYIEKQNKTII